MTSQTLLDVLPDAVTTQYPDLALHVARHGTGEIAVVELALPDKRNAMSAEMTESWGTVTGLLAANPDLRAVVVTGRGKGFCAGGQLDWIVAEPDAPATRLRERMAQFYATWLSIGRVEVPTIAAVNGHAIGAGLAVALACDLRVVSTAATLAMPFTHLGLHPGMASTWLLPQAVGLPVARDMLLTGRRVSGADAVGLGLASRAVEPDAVLSEALEMARSVAESAPQAARLTCVTLRDGGHRSLADALQWEALAQGVTMTTEDLREGIAAAADRRPARFTGR